MASWIEQLLSSDFMPHGHCLLWRPDLLAIHVIPDLIIALSYFVIPFALIYLIKKRHDLSFDWIFVMFSVFIFACGTTHIFEIINIWHGYYYAAGMVKVITALASITTAIMVWLLMPKILAIPSNATLYAKNMELKTAQLELQNMNTLLERRVEERTAELKKSNQQLDEFAYAASHDLKQPLRGINNYATFLLEDYGDKLAEDGKSRLQTLIQLSKELDQLISSLLEYAREGRTEFVSQAVNLDEVVASALSPLQILIDEYRINLIKPKNLPIVKCDKIRIQQALNNLVSNAMKYNDKPEKRIEIGVCKKSELTDGKAAAVVMDKIGVNDVILYVRDNGIGIPKKHHELVFGMFKRLHRQSEYGGGTGIGLAMVKKIIEHHGGQIWIESEPDVGTTIYFSLPQ
ncbi:MAG TPA: ATP-binding protein [Gammaproteobacteria bacterium]